MNFRKSVFQIALPITLQSLVQASFSVIDQVMTGQLGSVSVTAIGLGGKFSSLFSVVVSAIATVAGIVFAQYIGSGDKNGVSRMFTVNSVIISAISIAFQAFSMLIPLKIMSLYSNDEATVAAAGGYLFILAVGFLPQALSLLMSSLFRCQGNAKFPLYASLAAAAINTALNYMLIFGRMGMPELGVNGAATATTASRFAEFLILAVFMMYKIKKHEFSIKFTRGGKIGEFKMFMCVLLPMLATESLWSLGENVYAGIYGRIGTDDCAAMTLINPVQSLMIGAMTGLSAASGIIIGRHLGEGNEKAAYDDSKKFIKYGFIGSITLSVILFLLRPLYVEIFNVNDNVKHLTSLILAAYAIIAPIKVENMILGGGIVRSGGKTKYIMMVDIFGTWCLGVPLGLISAFVFHLPIYWVYFILSLEECARFAITLWIFKRKKWMNNLTVQEN